MNIERRTIENFLAIVTTGILLSGCLSDGESTGLAGDPVQDDPGPPAGGNSAPVITGAPPGAVVAGNVYSFAPQASDADGDTLTFSIQNKPSWATFSTSNGSLSGTPAAGDVGMYSNIVVAVSDGQVSTSLPSFSVNVSQVALGSASVSWSAPTGNSDGSQLTNLAGFRVYYGTDANNLTNFVEIQDPTLRTYVVDNLVPNTYFFGATAYNSDSIESGMSNVASKVVAAP